MHSWRRLGVLLLGTLWVFLAPLAPAQEQFADIEAAAVQYDDTGQLMQLSGSVRVTLDELTLHADELTYWREHAIASTSSSVAIDAQGRTLLGHGAVVDMKAGTFRLHHPRGQTEVKGAEGPLYFTGETLEGDASRMILTNARVTSCGSNCGRDEYHIKAQRVTILPDSKIVLKKAALYIGSERVFYWPLLILSLKEKPDLIPKIGWNKDEGYYFKLKYLYLAKETILGYVIYDYLQKKGTQTGAQHDWETRIGKGGLTYKQLEDKLSGRVNTNVVFTQDLSISKTLRGNTAFSKNQTEANNTRTDNRSLRLNLARQAGRSNYTLAVQEQGNFATTSNKTRNTNLGINKPLSRNWSLQSTWAMSETTFGNNPTNQDLRGDLSLNANMKFFSLRTRFTRFYDIDGDTFPGPDANGNPRDELTAYENLRPELFFTFKPNVTQHLGVPKIITETLGLSPVNMTQLTVQRISREREPTSRLYSGKETIVNAGWNARHNLWGASTLLSFNQTLTQTLFGTGDKNFLSNTTWQFNKNFSRSWQFNTTYQESELEGGVPLQGARSNSSQRLTGTLQQTRGPWQFRLSSGFDYRFDRYQPLALNLTRRMGLGATFTANTSRDLHSHRWSPIRGTYSSNQRGHRITSAVTYGIGPGTLTNWTTRYERTFNTGWSVGFTAVHGKNLRQQLLRDILLRKANCCTQLQMAYRPQDKDFQLLYVINAFPSKNLTFSASDGDLDLGTNLFDRFNQQTSGGFSN